MAETIFRKERKEQNFTVLDNTFIKDCNISWKAKGLMTYLLSLPEDWNIYLSELENHATDGKDSLNSAIKELEEAGYIVKEQIKNKGKFCGYSYTIYEKPKNRSGKTATEKPFTEKPFTENPQLLNTNSTNNLNKQNKEKQRTKKIQNTDNSSLRNLEKPQSLTMFLYQECKKDNSRFSKTDSELLKWTQSFDKLNRIDGYSWEEIERILKWAKADTFWRPNILSGVKFREKFETLFAQNQKQTNNNRLAKCDQFTQEELDSEMPF